MSAKSFADRVVEMHGPDAERAVRLYQKHNPGEPVVEQCRMGHGLAEGCPVCFGTGAVVKREVFQLENRIQSDRQDLIILLIVWVVGCGLLWLVAAAGPQVPEDVLRCAQEAAGAGAFEVVDCQGGGR